MERKAELLAPAGSFDIFRAVLSAGADAVYAGTKRFSARAFAENFSDEEFLRAMDEAHVRGRKCCLTLNTLIREDEMSEALRTAEKFYEAGLDGVIVQDFGLAEALSDHFPDLELHASTQMSVTGPYGMKLLEENGFSQAVLARELSLAEIREIAQTTQLKLECFIHGALCYCYSGKCLMSSVIGGRSANRGRCAQPCRLPYQLTEQHAPERHGAGASYPLSLKDLCGVRQIPALLSAGVSSFKIEGRMKGPEYAAGVTEIYRRILDNALEGLADEHPEETTEHLTALGSRSGFTDGYLNPRRAQNMVSLERPSHRKDSESDIVKQVRTRCAAEPEKCPVGIGIRIRQGEPAVLTMSCGAHTAAVSGEMVQKASDRALSEDTVRGKITRLGETPFAAAEVAVDLEENSFLRVSQLNRLRQEAVSQLLQSFRPVRMQDSGVIRSARKGLTLQEKASCSGPKKLYVSVLDEAQLEAVLRENAADAVIADGDAFLPGGCLEQAAARIRKAGKECIIALPHTFRPQTAARWTAWFQNRNLCASADGYLLRNPDEIAFAHAVIPDPQALLIADAGLYCWNRQAKAFFNENGIRLITVPFELSRTQTDPTGMLLTLYGHTPLMVSAQCVQKNTSHCEKRRDAGSDAPEKMRMLKDRKGKKFPVRRLCTSCENIIYNCVPTVLFKDVKNIRQMEFSGYRIDFLSEKPEEIREVFVQYHAFLAGRVHDSGTRDFTYGAWKRGTE